MFPCSLATCTYRIAGVYVLNTLSVSMFGLNPMQLANCKPNLYNPYRGRLRKVWYILRRISHTRLFGISKEVIDQFTRLETQGLSVEPEVKTKLADIYDGLNPQEQRMWIRYFPYAKFIGQLAKMRKSNTEPVEIILYI
ncbi:hypothetical protein GCK32_018273 [Trichostrongylus colubriformis]|uniref:Uncharacterized protein n=1 Tax=Trichostrongylus colubriformis TaxID=6319 RepID=A0AAN8F6A0_TRICO